MNATETNNRIKTVKGYSKITKEEFYACGAFSNPRLIRVTRKGAFAYFEANLDQGRIV